LKVDLKNPEKSFSVIKQTHQMSEQPFDQNRVPVLLEVEAAKVKEWSMERNSVGTLPESPIEPDGSLEKVCLIPYGAARLRIAQFPYFEE
jgi:ribosome maturation protein Sdo1